MREVRSSGTVRHFGVQKCVPAGKFRYLRPDVSQGAQVLTPVKAMTMPRSQTPRIEVVGVVQRAQAGYCDNAICEYNDAMRQQYSRKTYTSNRFKSVLMSRCRVTSVEIEARMSDRMRAVSRRASSSSFFVGA